MNISLSKKAVVWSAVLAAAACLAGCSTAASAGGDHPTNDLRAAVLDPPGPQRPGEASAPPSVVKFAAAGQPVTWTVPEGVTSVTFEAAGASGGGTFGGSGADITGTLAVTPGQTLVVAVGSNGSSAAHAAGGWGYNQMSGGPANTATQSNRNGGSGGGATFIGVQNGAAVTPLVISGGGGGSGGGSSDPAFAGPGGKAGCAAVAVVGPIMQPVVKCTAPSLTGGNGGHGTLGPLGGNGGTAGASPTSTGERGTGATNLGGNGGSGGGGLKGGAAGTGAKSISAGGGGGAGTSWYDTTAVSNFAITTVSTPIDTPATLSKPGVIITYPAAS